MYLMRENVINSLFWPFKFNITQNPKYGRSWVSLRPTCATMKARPIADKAWMKESL